MRMVTVAGAQLGPIQKDEPRAAVVGRMLALMDAAKQAGADLIVFPELALTTFFPRWYMEDPAEIDGWFERGMPNAATRPRVEPEEPNPEGRNNGRGRQICLHERPPQKAALSGAKACEGTLYSKDARVRRHPGAA